MAANVTATRKFTVDEYHRMAEAGILREDDRLELIEGTIVEMAPIGSRHALCVDRLVRAFNLALEPKAAWVRAQNPLRLPNDSEPEPDVVLAEGPSIRYTDRHPEASEVLLLVEVADTSLPYDRETKLPLYASAGIPEVWLFDLTQDRVEVYTEPEPRSYASRRIVVPDDTISPAAFPSLRIALRDIIP